MPILTTFPAKKTESVEKSTPVSVNLDTLPIREQQRVIYPEEKTEICTGANAITEDAADVILDWITEHEYKLRKVAENPGTEMGQYSYGDVYMLKDHEGNKVRCLNNLDNRPFENKWCEKLEHTILQFQWAGKITFPEEIEFVYGKPGMEPWVKDGVSYPVGSVIKLPAGTINGSGIGISRTGRLESGQHSLCALKRACQKYRMSPRGTYPQWDEYLEKYGHLHQWGKYGPAPVIETILVTGLSEDHRVLSSVDHCKPRDESDVFYTSDIFVKLRNLPGKRRELSRMLSACVELFWKMTKRQGYKTHAEVMQLVLDHPKLIKAVEHIFKENADVRRSESGRLIDGCLITNLKLSAGQCACLCYIMGSSASDGDEYRNGSPPKERGLDWSRWDKAKQFWSIIGESSDFALVRKLLTDDVVEVGDDVIHLTGSLVHQTRMTILAKAWDHWHKEERAFTHLDLEEGGCLHLTYQPACERIVNDEVVIEPVKLIEDAADFGGIDYGSTTGTPIINEDEMERRKEITRIQREQDEVSQHQQARAERDTVPIRKK